jgi:hypothetical protein
VSLVLFTLRLSRDSLIDLRDRSYADAKSRKDELDKLQPGTEAHSHEMYEWAHAQGYATGCQVGVNKFTELIDAFRNAGVAK